VGSFQNLIVKNYEARKDEFYMKLPDMEQRQDDYIMSPRGSDGANGIKMHIVFLHEPRLLR
jgi:hypothetical protein